MKTCLYAGLLMLAAALNLQAGEQERTKLDFTDRVGKIRRALHSSGWGGQLTGRNSARYEQIRPLNLKAARTHDWALANPGQRVCDLHFIFPLLHADTADARNYFFGPTDEIFEMTIEDLDMDILYRMGTSIESVNKRRNSKTRPARYYNSVEPADWEQFAKAQAQIIRHYTEGWANGFKWGERMRYWELWNEPNDTPGGSWIRADGDRDKAANDERFWEFAVHVLTRLKKQFPALKFGAPATCGYDEPFLRGFLAKCKAAGYRPDFISWHTYTDRPEKLLAEPQQARKLVDEFGFRETELFIDEWHYVPGDDCWGWFGGPPEVFSKLLSPKDGLKSIDAAVFALQVVAGLQSTVLDQSYYYGCSHDDWDWGYRRTDSGLGKPFYALKFFGDVIGACDEFVRGESPTACNPVRAFGAWSREGKRAYLIATVYRGRTTSFDVEAKGLGKMRLESVSVLDFERDGTAVDPASVVTREGDVLHIRKAHADRAAAYLMEFK